MYVVQTHDFTKFIFSNKINFLKNKNIFEILKTCMYMLYQLNDDEYLLYLFLYCMLLVNNSNILLLKLSN